MLYFIVNEKARSGKGAEIWHEVQMVLHKDHIDYKAWVTEYEGHAFSLAKDICAREDEDICLVVVGGDGTVNEVINGMTHFKKVRFGMIPTGSGNDLAGGLSIEGNPVENLKAILTCMEMGRDAAFVMDLGRVSWKGGEAPRMFAISAGTGLDALVCKKALKSKLKDFLNKIHLGKLTYLILTVQTLLSMDTTDVLIRFDGKGQEHKTRLMFAAAMNLRAEGGGVPMAPLANAADGKLNICSASGFSRGKAFLCLPFLVMAKHESIRGFDVRECRKCDIRLKQPMVLHADGEYCGDVTEIHFECLPGKLRVLK